MSSLLSLPFFPLEVGPFKIQLRSLGERCDGLLIDLGHPVVQEMWSEKCAVAFEQRVTVLDLYDVYGSLVGKRVLHASHNFFLLYVSNPSCSDSRF